MIISSKSSSFEEFNGCDNLDPSRYRAIAFTPVFHASRYTSPISLTNASAGIFTVLEIAPEIKGCAAAIMRTWAIC